MQTDLIILEAQPAFAYGIWGFISSHKQFSNNIIISDHYETNYLDLLNKSNNLLLLFGIDNVGFVNLELIAKFIKTNPSIKIVCFGNFEDLKSIEAIKNIGCNGYFQRSSNENTIINTINNVLNNKRVFNIELIQGNKSLQLDISIEEKALLYYIANGLSTKEIASKMNKSKNTIDFRKNTLFKKSNTKNIAGLVNFAHLHKLV